jgi:cytochrome P450
MAETSITFNPYEPGFAENPYPHYRALLAAGPVHRSPLGSWMILSYEHARRFLHDPSLSVEDRHARARPGDELLRQILGDRVDRGSQSMLNRDPPDHTRLRRLVSKAFTPRRIAGLRRRIGELVDAALDPAVAAGSEVELIGTLAFPLPFTIISEMLGMPDTDRDRLREWSGLLVRSLEPLADVEVMHAIAEASDAMRDYVSEVIAWKRREPADDLLSSLIAAEEQGDVLSDEELLDQVILLYIAGHETTVNLIGNGALALALHPEQLEALVADSSLIGGAVEELLRYDSPVQMSRRITREDVVVAGENIEAGSFVVVVLASANRDPEHWGDSADRLDITRPDANQHLAFGGGGHYCLGAALARLEAEIALGACVRRGPGLALAGSPEWNGRMNLRGLSRLPVRLG